MNNRTGLFHGNRRTALLRLAACSVALLCRDAAWAGSAPKLVRVGVYSNPPKIALDRGGKPSGLYAEVIDYVGQREHWQVQYVEGTFQESLSRLERGELDVMVDVARTPDRERRFDFSSEAVLHSWNEVYARRDLGIRYMSQLQGRRVGVLRGSVQELLFSQAAADWGVSPALVPFDTFEAAFAAAENGQLDAVVANHFFGQRRSGQFAQTAIVFGSHTLHFAAPKGRSAPLLAALDRHLVSLKADPSSVYSREFQALVRDQRPVAVPDWVYHGAAAGALTGIILLAWALSARKAARRLRAAESEQRKLADERMHLLREAHARERELHHANEDLQIVSHSLSHDLGAPLAAFNGFVRAARDSAGDALNATEQRLLDRSLAAARRMEAMVCDLGAMLRVAGQPLDLRECDLTALANEVVEGLRVHQSGQPEIIIAGNLVARVDPQMVRVALDNLLGNAWKFSSSTKQPVIEMGRLPDGITYYVRDNGAGFPMEYASKLFRPFSRLHGVDEFPGSGIGLSIVKRIIARHRGRIWAESAVDRGTTFYFTLAESDA
ncbi:MAG: sensor histidine kinase [Ramlibacter sp.]